MITISRRDRRQRAEQQEQLYRPADALMDTEATWGETFTASVGFVFDEELSISSLLNNEMYANRDAAATELADSGVDLRPYQDKAGKLDYDGIAKAFPDSGVGSDVDMYRERKDLLAKRRSYSEDVKERGSGMAQFVGSMSGYMLDPVNVATLPIGASVSVLRGLSVMARVGRVAAIEGAIGLTAETLIQPFVFQHKNEIGSPYNLDDALAAIGTAAVGGAALGGATAGVAGVLRSIGKIADDYPGNIDAQGSAEVMMKASEDILKNPERAAVTEGIGDAARHYSARTSGEIAEEIEALKAADELTPDDAVRLEVAEAVLGSRKGRWRSKVDAEVLASRGVDVERMPLQERQALADELTILRATEGADEARISDIESTLQAQREVDASIDSQMIQNKNLKNALEEIGHRRLVDTDIEYMRRLEAERVATGDKKATPDTYEVNAERLGPEAYEQADIEAFEAMGEDGIVRMGDENVSARQFIDERNIELEGLEAARVCSIV